MEKRWMNTTRWILSAVILGAICIAEPTQAEDGNKRPDGAYDPASFAGSHSRAKCHPQHYDEWRGSAHAYAVTDPISWGANEESYAVNGTENFCLTCHSPPADVTNPEPSGQASAEADLSEAAREGVNCETCHRIFDTQHGAKQMTACEVYYFGPLADTSGFPHRAECADDLTRSGGCKPRRAANMSTENMDGPIQIEFTHTEWDEENSVAGGDPEHGAMATC
jgi:hypothetical protein